MIREIDGDMKKGMQEIRIHMGMFDFNVIFIFGPYSKVEQYMRWKYEDDTIDVGPETFAKTFSRVGYVPVVWMDHYPKTCTEIASLSHECCHVITNLFEWASMSMNHHTEEVLGHGVGYLVRSVLNTCMNRMRQDCAKSKKKEI